MTNLVKTGQIPAGQTQAVVAVGNMDAPMTATIISAAAGRKIELSTTGDASEGSWYTVTPDATTASMINAAIRSPVAHIRFTGVALDTFRVQ